MTDRLPPPWLDRTAYPFASRWLDVDAGRMHYVDEGDGPSVLMLHGNPTWSFLYRHLVRGLSDRYRCVAPDYLGFGLSDKPPGWTYRPVDHARHIAHLIDTLDLRDLTLVVQDWGGPIGLWYAVHHPERIRRLVVMNTWMWPVAEEGHFVGFSTLMGGPLGRLACTYLNAFARFVMPLGFGDRARLTPDAHRHYLRPLDCPEVRKGTWVFPREIVGSTVWLARLWARRHAITDRPALLVWGLKDIAFREHELRRWQALLPHAETQRLPTVGHYVQEEMGPALVPIVRDFLRRTES